MKELKKPIQKKSKNWKEPPINFIEWIMISSLFKIDFCRFVLCCSENWNVSSELARVNPNWSHPTFLEQQNQNQLYFFLFFFKVMVTFSNPHLGVIERNFKFVFSILIIGTVYSLKSQIKLIIARNSWMKLA